MCTEKRGQILTTYWLLRSRYINMHGIWSNSSLSVPSEYGATLGDDFKGDRIRRQNRANRRRQEFQALQGYRACLIGHNSRRAFHNGRVFDLGLERLEADYGINGLGTLRGRHNPLRFHMVEQPLRPFFEVGFGQLPHAALHSVCGISESLRGRTIPTKTPRQSLRARQALPKEPSRNSATGRALTAFRRLEPQTVFP